MAVLFTNNAQAALSATITAAATSFSVAAGLGALFPSPGVGDHFFVTLADTAGNLEIVKVTARNTDTFTVVRGQDGTEARAFSSGDKVELRLTKAMLDQIKLDTQQNIAGNLSFTGTGNRITGDFTNATYANRVLVQTSTVNGNTFFGLIPNGTAVNAQFQVFNSSDPANSALATFTAASQTVRLVSSATGTGTTLPIVVVFGSAEAARFATNGNFLLGSQTDNGTDRLQVTGSANITGALKQGGNQVLHAGNYTDYALSTSGGTLSSTVDGILTLNKSSGTAWNYINFSVAGTRRFYFGLNASYEPELGVDNGATFRVNGAMTVGGNTVVTSGNYSSYALPLSGGTLTGKMIAGSSNGDSIEVRNDTASAASSGYITFKNKNSSGVYRPAARISGANVDNAFDGDFLIETYSGGVAYKGLRVDENSDVWFYDTSGNTKFQWDAVNSRALINSNVVLHAGNYSSYALPLGGGSLTTGASSNIFIGRNSTATNYNAISLNGNSADSSNMGLTGGGVGDSTLYMNSPGDINVRTNSFGKSFWFRTNGEFSAPAAIVSGGNGGFANDVWYGGVRNPIWRFGNAEGYGLSYFQGAAGIGGADTIGFHFGTATAAASHFAMTPTTAYVNGNVVLTAINFSNYALPNPGSGTGGRVLVNLSGNPSWSDINFTYDPIMGQFRATNFRANVGDAAPTWNFNAIMHGGNYTGFSGVLRAGGGNDGMDFNTLAYNTMYYAYISDSPNRPGNRGYSYGTILTFDPGQGTGGRAQFYVSHAGNDLIFRGDGAATTLGRRGTGS